MKSVSLFGRVLQLEGERVAYSVILDQSVLGAEIFLMNPLMLVAQ